MELTFEQQSLAFFLSILLGAACGVLYGLFKIFRTVFCLGKVSLFLTDFIFMIIVSLGIFIFSLAYLLGYVRIYVYIGCGIGFFAYRLTLGRLFSGIYCPIIRWIIALLNKFCIKIKKITKKLLKIANKILYNISNKKSSHKNKRSEKIEQKRVIANNEKRKGKSRTQKK